MPGNWKKEFKKTFVQTIFQISTQEIFFMRIILFIMQNLTNFWKMVETGVDSFLFLSSIVGFVKVFL